MIGRTKEIELGPANISLAYPCKSQDYFVGLDASSPKQIKTQINLRQIRVWGNVWTEKSRLSVPNTMEILSAISMLHDDMPTLAYIGHEIEPIHRSL